MSAAKTFFVLFRSIHDVLKVEKALKKSGAVFELVPVPRQISSECGVCIKSVQSPKELLPLGDAPHIDRCYTFDGKDYVLISLES